MASMTILMERRTSRSAGWARKFANFSLVLLLVASLGHRYGLVETLAFLWVLALVPLLAIMALFLAALGFHRLWHYGAKGGRASLMATLVSLLVLAPFIYSAVLYLQHPHLADITTDPEQPPAYVLAQWRRTTDMNTLGNFSVEEVALQASAYPNLRGRRFDGSMDRVLKAIKVVLEREGWVPVQRLPSETQDERLSFEVVAPTWLLRLPSDGVVRMVDEGEAVFVDLRLSQRYFWHDLGSGARRIERFMAALDAEFDRQSLEIIDIPASAGEEDSGD